jgi:hypothetical protein
MAEVTIANLNMLCVRYLDRTEREIHLPLGPLYLARSLEEAGIGVDFRDYQLCDQADLFTADAIGGFLDDPREILLVSCMANLLPFTVQALRSFREAHPDVFVALGGVGASGVEERLLELCPWIDVIGVGEGERTVVELVHAVQNGKRNNLKDVCGIVWRDSGSVVRNPPRERIRELDSIPFPAHHLVDLSHYAGINVISSRGCPFSCSFCSVAPIWGRKPFSRSPENILAEMQLLHEQAGADLFLFQDEYFVSSPQRVQSLCRAIDQSGLKVRWKAFGRVDLTDIPTMEAMARAGCVEIRYGIESGCERTLAKVTKGFDPQKAFEVLSDAVGIFPGVDAFYMWGFPFETLDDFNESLLHMIGARTMGVRILPSLLSLLPQTTLYHELGGPARLEFFPELFPEYMLTGHEICADGRIRISDEHRHIYDFISAHPDVFPGFFHLDVERNVLPKYALLQRFGFYTQEGRTEMLGSEVECCGAHSPEP